MRMSLPSSSMTTLPPPSRPTALRNSAGRLRRPEDETCPRTSFLACSVIVGVLSRTASPRNIGISRDRGNVGIDFSAPLAISPGIAASSYNSLPARKQAMAFADILYEKRDGIATITINRPKVLNAFRGETVEEMLAAMRDAEGDPAIGVVVLAGAGERAFCAGGDNSARASGKPVIAKVQGYAIGGGNVLATVCDLTIASDKAVFG